MGGLNCVQKIWKPGNFINRLDTCLWGTSEARDTLVTAIHLLHRFLIQIFFLLEPRLRKQPILWKDLFNKKRIKLSVLNKVDHCETWVKSHREEYVRLTALYNKTAFNSWVLCSFWVVQGRSSQGWGQSTRYYFKVLQPLEFFLGEMSGVRVVLYSMVALNV